MAASTLVFTSQKEIISTTVWLQSLSKTPDDYGNCFVRRITHVKNLLSPVAHEYLQVIVEDTGGGQDKAARERTRVLTERQTAQDQVIIGMWSFGQHPQQPQPPPIKQDAPGWKAFGKKLFATLRGSLGSGGGGLLPSPMWSLTFDEDNLNVIDLAHILAQTTNAMGTYELTCRNCYAFARTVYEAAQLSYHGVPHAWTHSYLRGLPLKLGYDVKGTAQTFDKQNNENFQYVPAEKLSKDLSNLYAAAVEFLRQEGVELSDEEAEYLSEYSASLDNAERTTHNALKNADTKEVELITQESVDNVLKSPHKDDFLNKYEKYASQAPKPVSSGHENAAKPLSWIEVQKFSAELERGSEDAVKVLVATVLEEMEKPKRI